MDQTKKVCLLGLNSHFSKSKHLEIDIRIDQTVISSIADPEIHGRCLELQGSLEISYPNFLHYWEETL